MKLNLLGPINQTSYGYVTTYIAKSLSKKCNLYFQEVCKPSSCEIQDQEFIRGLLQNKFFHHNAPCIRIWHQHDMSYFVGKGKKIGWPIFELDRFTDLEKHHLSFCDELIVCSEWAKSVVEKELPGKSVHVVPLGVDSSVFYPKKFRNNDNYIFLNIGKWEIRKGHDKLIEAFNSTFCETDKVELWMCCDNPFLTEERKKWWINLAKQSKLGNKIRLIPRQEKQSDIARLINMADCGVFPHRAEGWGMPILDMIACGKPIITTNYSGNTQFCSMFNSSLIQVDDELEDAYDEPFFKGQGQWLKWKDDYQKQLTTWLRLHYDNQWRENNNSQETVERFSWDNTTNKILSLISKN